jgi:hypothetical protein
MKNLIFLLGNGGEVEKPVPLWFKTVAEKSRQV